MSAHERALRDILDQRRYPSMGWEPDQADDGSWWWRKADGEDFTYEHMTDNERSAYTALAFGPSKEVEQSSAVTREVADVRTLPNQIQTHDGEWLTQVGWLARDGEVFNIPHPADQGHILDGCLPVFAALGRASSTDRGPK